MPKYKDLIAEFAHAFLRYKKFDHAFDQEWTITRPSNNAVDPPPHDNGVVVMMRRQTWGGGADDNPSTFFLRTALHIRDAHHHELRVGDLNSQELRKLAELKARVELWEGGFRDELPTQAEVDEL